MKSSSIFNCLSFLRSWMLAKRFSGASGFILGIVILSSVSYKVCAQEKIPAQVKAKLDFTYEKYSKQGKPEVSLSQFTNANLHVYSQQANAANKIRNRSILKSPMPKTTFLEMNFSTNCNAPNTICGNGDFESGAIDVGEWRGAYGTWGSGQPDPFTLTDGFISGDISDFNAHQTIVTPGPDPNVPVNRVTANGGQYALRIGNAFNNYGTELMSKTIAVTAGQTIIPFSYALVFQDPGHAPANQPAFSVRAFDCHGVELPPVCDLGNGTNIAVSDANNPFFKSANGGTIAYRDWSTAQLDLSPYIGQTITVVFLNKDCGLGGHWGYTYIDNLCVVCSSGCPYNISLNSSTTNCGVGQVCVDYSLPQTDGVTGNVTIDLDIYQNGAKVTTVSSATLSTGTSYCFAIDPAALGIDASLGGFDYIVTGRFSIKSFNLSPIIVGQPPSGQQPGQNNDYLVSVTEAKCKNATITLVNGSASLTLADIDNGSIATCGFKSKVLSKYSFDCSNIGVNKVTLTITDVNNKTSTCEASVTVVGVKPVCSIAAIPSNNINTGGVPTNIYLGYGPQSVTLTPTVSGGAPFTYSWSPAAGLSSTTASTPVFTPTVAGSFTFIVTITNKFGCTTTCSITICVLDIRVPGTDGKKVYVCHLPPGNPGNAQELSISVNAVPAHVPLHGGDHLGKCSDVPCAPATSVTLTPLSQQATSSDIILGSLNAMAIPNPSVGTVKLMVTSKDNSLVSVRILDTYGRVLEVHNGVAPNSNVQLGSKLTTGTYYAEVMQGGKRVLVKLSKLK